MQALQGQQRSGAVAVDHRALETRAADHELFARHPQRLHGLEDIRRATQRRLHGVDPDRRFRLGLEMGAGLPIGLIVSHLKPMWLCHFA